MWVNRVGVVENAVREGWGWVTAHGEGETGRGGKWRGGKDVETRSWGWGSISGQRSVKFIAFRGSGFGFSGLVGGR